MDPLTPPEGTAWSVNSFARLRDTSDRSGRGEEICHHLECDGQEEPGGRGLAHDRRQLLLLGAPRGEGHHPGQGQEAGHPRSAAPDGITAQGSLAR
jgi:hypothetical protein